MALPEIAIVQRSSSVRDADLAPVVAALARQVDEHLGPAWGVAATLTAIPVSAAPPDGSWPIFLVDSYDRAAHLVGHHESRGRPSGVVSVARAQQAKMPWSAALSHELCELLVNPWTALCFQVGETVLALEPCDPVEYHYYEIDGIDVSNFVLPSWFRKGSRGPWDFLKRLAAPLVLAEGGYLSSAALGMWNQSRADRDRSDRRGAHPLSRRGRRAARR